MARALVFASLAILATGVAGIKDYCQPAVCGALKESGATSPVADYCTSEGLKMDDRCCRNGTTVLGLDLRDCGLNETTILRQDFYKTVVILDLTANAELEKTDEDDFDGYSSLKSLFFDRHPNITCPGGENSWQTPNGGDNGEFSAISSCVSWKML